MMHDDYGFVSRDEESNLLGMDTAVHVVTNKAVNVGPRHYDVCESVRWVTDQDEGFELGGKSITSDHSEENTSKVANTSVHIVVHRVRYNAFTIRKRIVKNK